MSDAIKVVGIGGAIRPGSTSEKALHWVTARLGEAGAQTQTFVGADLHFPLFDPSVGETPPGAGLHRYIEAVRDCAALVIASPVYHGGPSGLLKNALDHLQPLVTDRRPYLTHRAVLCLAAGGGLPGALSTLSSLRDVVHALRGWPTPMQVPINSSTGPFAESGDCSDSKLERSLRAGIGDLWRFATMSHHEEARSAAALAA